MLVFCYFCTVLTHVSVLARHTIFTLKFGNLSM